MEPVPPIVIDPIDSPDDPPSPSIEDTAFVALDPRLLRLRLILAGVVAVLLLVPAVAFAIVVDSTVGLVAVAVVALATAVEMLVMRTSFRFWGYQVRDADLTVRHGVLNRSSTSVSFNRVQHASLQSGPLERSMGLATINVFTAGGIGALRIEGLPTEVAEELQERILRRVAVTGRSTATPPGPVAPVRP